MRRTSRDYETCSRLGRSDLRPDARDQTVGGVGVRRVLIAAQKEHGRLPAVRFNIARDVDRIWNAADTVAKSHASQIRGVEVRADESLAGQFRRTILGGYYRGNMKQPARFTRRSKSFDCGAENR